MKKIEIHIFPEKTGKRKFFRISIGKLIWIFIGIATAVLGFILFDPLGALHLVLDKQVVRVYQENKYLKKEIQKAETQLDFAKAELAKTNILKDSLFQKKSMQHIQQKDSAQTTPLPTLAQNIPTLTKRRNKLLQSLLANKDLAEALPLVSPVQATHTITNRYETLFDPFTEQELPHLGIDFATAPNDTVFAPGAGIVSETREHRGFGLTLKLEHTKQIRTFYAHLNKVLVSSGQRVKRGTPIAIVGNSGRVPGTSLHYEIRYDGNAINPEDYFLLPLSTN